jgi:hypothetical protein
MDGKGRVFDSHQLKCAFSVSYFHLFLFLPGRWKKASRELVLLHLGKIEDLCTQLQTARSSLLSAPVRKLREVPDLKPPVQVR